VETKGKKQVQVSVLVTVGENSKVKASRVATEGRGKEDEWLARGRFYAEPAKLRKNVPVK